MMISLIFAAVLAAISFAIVRGGLGIVSAICVGLFSWMYVYFGLPTLEYGFSGVPFLLLFIGVITAIFGIGKNSKSGVDDSVAMIGGIGSAGLSLAFLLFVPMFSTWALIGDNDDQYRALIGTVEKSEFSADVSPIDPTAVRLVDQLQAAKLAETKLGEDTALGSRVNIGTFNIQAIKGKLYWVAPLNWQGVFKWAFGDVGTPGYMKVSATNSRDVELVRNVGGEPLSLQILDSGAFFGDDLNRVLYENGYASQGYTDNTFEVNDEGRPFWVVTKYDLTVGFGGAVATGVILVDPQTREIEAFDIDKVPEWVDRIQPESFVTTRINDYGNFVHGWWNPSGLERTKATPGMSLVYGDDGQAYWYTGIQSVGKDQGTLGFMLVNSRTGLAKFYKQTGITEQACQGNIQGLVAEKPGWVVTNCILYNVSGDPTYIAIIKDAKGNPKYIAAASVKYRAVVVKHANIRGTMRAYKAMLRSKGGTIAVDGKVKQIMVKGQVVRIGTEVLDGKTYYFLLIAGHSDKILSAIAGLSAELPITQKVDMVSIGVDDAGSGVVDMSSFDNLGILLQKTDAQTAVEAQDAKTR